MRIRSFVTLALLAGIVMPGLAQAPRRNVGAPETFSANANAAKPGAGAIAATVQIHIERYTPDADRTAVETALKSGGYAAFVAALRKAPEVGLRTARRSENPHPVGAPDRFGQGTDDRGRHR